MLPSAFSSLRVRLLSLVLLAALPALGLVLYSDIELRREAETRSLARTRDLAARACENIENALADVRVVLQTMTQAPEVRALDRANCGKLFQQVLASRPVHRGRGANLRGADRANSTRAGPFTAIALADLEGQVVASSTSSPLPESVQDQDVFQLALATHDIVVGAHPADRLTDRPGVNAAYRVVSENGRVLGVLIVALDVGWLSEEVAGGLLPEGSSLLVLDARGTVLAASPAPQRFTGREFPDVPVVHDVLRRREGVIRAEGLTGVDRLWSFQPVRMTSGRDLFVALGFEPKSVFAEADRTARRMGLVLLLVAGATALALWLWARRVILHPLDMLTRATRRLREGNLASRAALDTTGELGELGRSFDEMADSLQAHARELSLSNQTLQAVLASSPVAVIALDLDRKVTMWPPAAERLFGWSAAEVLGREAPFTPPEHEEVARRYAAHAGRGQELTDVEWTAVRKDGRPLLLSVSTALLIAPDGVRGQVCAMADLTARRRLERQLQNAQKMEALGRLAAGVAHGFNNLLTVIRGAQGMILSRPKLDAESRRDAERAQEAAIRASMLTTQLMAFGCSPTAPSRPVDLNGVVAGMSLMLQRALGEDIEVHLELRAHPGWVMIEPDQIEQVIANLAVNAREAMPQGGTIQIETGNHECPADPERRCRPECPGPSVTLEVRDTGIGMDATVQRHLFEPFYTTKEEGRGSGLGLSTVYGVVQRCGGDIEVFSEPGEGSTFRISFPLAPAPPPEEEGNGHPPGSGTLLLVEDDDAVRTLERSMLEHLGYRVLATGNGREALDVAKSHAGSIELLVADVVMPELSGPEVAREVRRLRPGIRVLYLSGYAPGESVQAAEDLDAPLLSKPFALESLARKVREALAATARELAN
ncbi:MAG TPA: ATP-binding protein [Terriglobales bacterium]|nr:ATP-binding protein [Terriglobales bacterium]